MDETTRKPADLLPVGTPVRIVYGSTWAGARGTVARAYRIRHGHPMYDVKVLPGYITEYYGADQLEVVE